MTSTRADIEAMVDVLDGIIETSTEVSLEEALSTKEALEGLIGTAKLASSMLETQAIRQLEQPKVVNGKRWKRTNLYAKRFDHGKIGSMVIEEAAIDRDTGEVRSTKDALRRALHFWMKIYLSDSTSAKTGELKRLLGVADAADEGLVREVATGTTITGHPVGGAGHAEPD